MEPKEASGNNISPEQQADEQSFSYEKQSYFPLYLGFASFWSWESNTNRSYQSAFELNPKAQVFTPSYVQAKDTSAAENSISSKEECQMRLEKSRLSNIVM